MDDIEQYYITFEQNQRLVSENIRLRQELAEAKAMTKAERKAAKAHFDGMMANHKENERLRIALKLTTHDEHYIKGFNEDELRRRLRHINQLVEKTLGEDLERIE